MSYKSKSQDSFISRLRIFIFDVVVNQIPFSLQEFLNYDLNKKLEVIHQFTSEYYQMERNHKINGMDLDAIYKEIKRKMNEDIIKSENWSKAYYNQVFNKLLKPADYKKIINSTTCFYCDITIEEINALANAERLYKKNERGWKMEIDRKEPNLEYFTTNCVPACYWCNNAKTDEFNAEEFKPIGELIGNTLRGRLKDNK